MAEKRISVEAGEVFSWKYMRLEIWGKTIRGFSAFYTEKKLVQMQTIESPTAS